ncbi:hypothetical protein [Kitasatospora aburaviensis]|uniref:Uncharacterized protein n=1 Tax=Kitasatospora aburaviensis TaxID=67265 RepID=A0ABW1F2R3_9ACTN
MEGSGTTGNRYRLPIEAGRAHLVRAELRGRDDLRDAAVHVDIHFPGVPYPNTWDHPGFWCAVARAPGSAPPPKPRPGR